MFTSSQYPQPYSFAPIPQQKPITITSLTTKNPLVSQLKSVLQQKLKKAQLNNNRKEANDQHNQSQQNAKGVPYPMRKERIFAPAGKAYFILNSLFQTYKKHNEFKLLQQKVHKIQVYHTDDDEHNKFTQQPIRTCTPKGSLINSHQTQQSFPSKIPQTPHVRPQIIFLSHQGQLSGKQIQKFIQIQGYIHQMAKSQLITQIVKSISGLNDVKEIMKCYQKLFSTKYCRQNSEIKEMVEEKMIKKILMMDFGVKEQQKSTNASNSTSSVNGSINNSNNNSSNIFASKPHPNFFQQIGHSLLGFPKITQNLLYLIGLLFDKVPAQNLQLYDLLYQIMKRNLSFNVNNLQQALTNPKNKKQIQALMKVNTKENNELIKGLLRAYTKVKEKCNNNDEGQIINVLKIAQTEAHYKLVKLMSEQQQLTSRSQSLSQTQSLSSPQPLLTESPPTIQPSLLPPQPLTLLPLPITTKQPQPISQVKQQIPLQKQQQPPISAKTQFTLKFITQVIKSGSNLWQQVNEWLKTTISLNSKSFLITQISAYLQRCLNDDKKFKSYILPHIRIINKDLEETSQVYRLWLRQLLKPITSDKSLKQNYLKFNIIKKFILKGVTNSHNIPLFIEDLFNPSLLHAQLLYDVFTIEKQKAFAFYKEILQTQLYSRQFFAFLVVLKDKNPIRLKQWLTQADQTKGGELFLCSRSVLIQFIKNHLKAQIAFNWIRDLSLFPPSKYLVWILISFISTYKSKKQLFQPFRVCIARTINLILIRNPVNKLCDQFKKHLPSLARQFTDYNLQYQIMFADVSAETQAELKRVHKESQGIKF